MTNQNIIYFLHNINKNKIHVFKNAQVKYMKKKTSIYWQNVRDTQAVESQLGSAINILKW